MWITGVTATCGTLKCFQWSTSSIYYQWSTHSKVLSANYLQQTLVTLPFFKRIFMIVSVLFTSCFDIWVTNRFWCITIQLAVRECRLSQTCCCFSIDCDLLCSSFFHVESEIWISIEPILLNVAYLAPPLIWNSVSAPCTSVGLTKVVGNTREGMRRHRCLKSE